MPLKPVSCIKVSITKSEEKAVRYWVMNEQRKKHIQKTGEDPVETGILYDNEATDNEQ